MRGVARRIASRIAISTSFGPSSCWRKQEGCAPATRWAPRLSTTICRQGDGTEGNMDLGLKGLRAVITGGTKGIGRSAANIFAQEGATVAICARNADDVKAAVKDLTAKGAHAFGAGIDVANKAALQKFIADSAQALGGIDILVANVSALAAQDVEESWSQSFDVAL